MSQNPSVNRFLKSAQKIQEEARERREEPKAQAGGGADESNWLISYADMMTLLCGFFIMLFSMAKLDQPEFEKVKEAVAKEFKGEYQRPHEELGRFMSQVLRESGIEGQAGIQIDPFGVSVVFESAVFFETLSAEVKPQGQQVLGRLIQGIARKQLETRQRYRIVVEGHTDQRPIIGGTYPSNWELSSARAARVVRMFLDQGFGSGQLLAIGYADTRPELPARRPSGEWDERALDKNRRVVVRILEESTSEVPLFPSSPAEPAKAAP